MEMLSDSSKDLAKKTWINEDELFEKDACFEGVDYFNDRFPNGTSLYTLISYLQKHKRDRWGYTDWLLQAYNLTGVSKEWRTNKKVYSETLYSKGRRDGLQKRYHPNGALCAEINYANGSLDGEWKDYHESGQLFRVSHYKSDSLKAQTYYSDGAIIKHSEIF